MDIGNIIEKLTTVIKDHNVEQSEIKKIFITDEEKETYFSFDVVSDSGVEREINFRWKKNVQ